MTITVPPYGIIIFAIVNLLVFVAPVICAGALEILNKDIGVSKFYTIVGLSVLFTIGEMQMILSQHDVLSEPRTYKIAKNSYGKPMYDIIPSDCIGDSSKYKVYLASGETKKVVPKIVHVNRSKKSYLKSDVNTRVSYFYNIKFKYNRETQYTLYLNDK